MNVGIVSKNHYLEYSGTYMGMDFVVLFNSAGFRTGYVNVKNTYLEKLDYIECDNYVDVHGGFTYKEDRLPFEHSISENHTWLGWDYAHWLDGYDLNYAERYFGNTNYLKVKQYSDIVNPDSRSHIYTLLDVISECKKVILQIKKGEHHEETNS